MNVKKLAIAIRNCFHNNVPEPLAVLPLKLNNGTYASFEVQTTDGKQRFLITIIETKV